MALRGGISQEHALLTVGEAPAIVIQPTNLTVPVGDVSTFNVLAGGTAPLSYRWSFNGTNLLFLAKLLRLWKPYSYAEVFGFDSFEGLRTFDPKGDLPPGEMEGTYRGSEELLEDAIEMHSLGDGLLERSLHVLWSLRRAEV